MELDESSIDPEDKKVLQILGNVQWEWARRHRIAVYALYRYDYSSEQPVKGPSRCVSTEDLDAGMVPEDSRPFFRSDCVDFEDESDEDLAWFGVSASGRWKARGAGRVYYWLEAAGVAGKETFTDYAGPNGSRYVSSRDRHNVEAQTPAPACRGTLERALDVEGGEAKLDPSKEGRACSPQPRDRLFSGLLERAPQVRRGGVRTEEVHAKLAEKRLVNDVESLGDAELRGQA